VDWWSEHRRLRRGPGPDAGGKIGPPAPSNVAAVSFAFMLALFGTAAVCAALAVWAIVDQGEADAGLLLAGSALYLVGHVGELIASWS
jgi:uncharacterized membrane protein